MTRLPCAVLLSLGLVAAAPPARAARQAPESPPAAEAPAAQPPPPPTGDAPADATPATARTQPLEGSPAAEADESVAGTPAPAAEAAPPPPATPLAPVRTTVVTSTRLPVAVDEQPRAMSVVTRDDLQRRPGRATPDALLEQEGVFLQKTNTGGGAPIIRGLYGQQVLLLVDGIRLNNSTVRAGPNQFLNTVDPFLVDQLEVVRGPGSVLYGSDALGGVINVRTFWPRFTSGPGVTPFAELRGVAGSADTSLQGHLRAGGATRDTAVAAAFTARDFNDLHGGGRVGLQRYTAYEEGDLSFKVRQRLSPRAQLYVQYQGVRQRNAPRLDRSAPGDFRRFTDQHRDFFHGRLQVGGLPGLRRATLELSSHRQGDATDRFRLGRNRVELDQVEVWTHGGRLELEARELGALPGRPVPLVGADLYHDRVFGKAGRTPLSGDGGFSATPVDARYPGSPRALAGGVFAALRSDGRERFSYSAGARVQLNRTQLPEDTRLAELFADADAPPPVLPAVTRTVTGVAGELGVQYRVAEPLALVANLGSGFRAPNVDDYLRAGTEGVGFLVPGGSELESEQSYTAEVGARFTHARVQAHAFYAYTSIPGLIGNVPTTLDGQARTPDDLPYLARRNRDVARIQSLEGALGVRVLTGLTLATHATYTHTLQRRLDLPATGPATDAVTIEEPLSRTAPLNGLVRLTWESAPAAEGEAPGRFFAEGVLRWATRADALSAADRVDTRICSEAPGCDGTPGWTSVALRGGARLSRHLAASLTLQNLFDTTYRTHGSGVDEPGRSVLLSVEASL